MLSNQIPHTKKTDPSDNIIKVGKVGSYDVNAI